MNVDCALLDLSYGLSTVYAVSLGVFALGTLVALGLFFTDRFYKSKEAALIATTVFFLQVVLYTALLLGQGAFFLVDVGSCQPWARWLTYTFSCGLLAYEIAGIARMPKLPLLLYILMVLLTLITGFFAAVASDINDRWVWFGFGFAPYLISLILLIGYSRNAGLIWFVIITWSLYPVIFLLGPLYLAQYSLTVESWLYLGADLLTKIGFEFWHVFDERSKCKR